MIDKVVQYIIFSECFIYNMSEVRNLHVQLHMVVENRNRRMMHFDFIAFKSKRASSPPLPAPPTNHNTVGLSRYCYDDQSSNGLISKTCIRET